jgi:peptidoglycan/LPS O-acetylase OafA/YrhL
LGGFLAATARRTDGLVVLRRALWPATAAASVMLVTSYVFNRFTSSMTASLHEARNGMIVVLLAALMLSPLLGSRPSVPARFFGGKTMRFLGKYSYGLYVFHHFITYYFVHKKTEFALGRWIGSHTIAVMAQTVFGFLVSLGAALLSYHLFESRFIALKRFWPTRTDAERPAHTAETVSATNSAPGS